MMSFTLPVNDINIHFNIHNKSSLSSSNRRKCEAKMGKTRRCQDPCFSACEIEHMERSILGEKSGLLDESFCKEITNDINRSSGRVGSDVIQVNQVREWVENKLRNEVTEITNLPLSSKQINVTETSSQVVVDEKEIIPDLAELQFEARSRKDSAWYDVSTFVGDRTTESGEVEMKVKYENFGDDENEWVNVKKDIRICSIPLDSSECYKVQVGDLVLCYRERDKEAVHLDAHVLEIRRKVHDLRGCRCQFLVRYDRDQTEESVHLISLCRRPPWASHSMHN